MSFWDNLPPPAGYAIRSSIVVFLHDSCKGAAPQCKTRNSTGFAVVYLPYMKNIFYCFDY